jgi:hypothetical protein
MNVRSREPLVCNGIKKDGGRCARRTRGGHCFLHASQSQCETNVRREYREEKPEQCPICTENFPANEGPLKCGHWTCMSCVEQFMKPECPMCRTELDNLGKSTLDKIAQNNSQQAREWEEEGFQALREEFEESAFVFTLIFDRYICTECLHSFLELEGIDLDNDDE